MALFQRVIPARIRKLLENIQSVNAAFDTFELVLINVSALVVQRVDKAIAKMYELVLSDVELIANLIQQKNAMYDQVFKRYFEISGYLFPYLMNTLNSIEVYCVSDRYNRSLRLLIGRMDITTFLTNKTIVYQRSTRNKGCSGQPWTLHNSRPDCQASLERIIKTINNASVSLSGPCPSDRITVTRTGNKMHWVWAKNCLTEYGSALHSANHELYEIANRIKRNIDPEFIFNYDQILGKISDMKVIHEMAERVAVLFTSYSHHQINKLDVAKLFINLFSGDDNHYDRILWTLDKYAFSYLTSKIDTMEEDTQRLFSDAFRIIESVMPYCNGDDTEQRLRNLSVWRYPLARLDVQDILSFKYTSEESWESWSLKLSFKQLMDTKLGEKLLGDIVTSYSSVLRGNILEIKSEIAESVSRIYYAIGLLVDDLKTFQKDNTINSDFIMWVCYCSWLNGPLDRYVNCKLRMRRECRERFPHHRLQMKPLVSDPSMHHGMCVTHVPWCMSGSLANVDWENVPGIPGACATHNFTYLARGLLVLTLCHPH